MKVTLRSVGRLQVLEVHGKLVLGETEELRDRFRGLLEENQARILIDLRKLSYMDSAGIGELAACRKRAAEKNTAVKLLKNKAQFSLPVETVVGLMYPDAIFYVENDALGSF